MSYGESAPALVGWTIAMHAQGVDLIKVRKVGDESRVYQELVPYIE